MVFILETYPCMMLKVDILNGLNGHEKNIGDSHGRFTETKEKINSIF